MNNLSVDQIEDPLNEMTKALLEKLENADKIENADQRHSFKSSLLS